VTIPAVLFTTVTVITSLFISSMLYGVYRQRIVRRALRYRGSTDRCWIEAGHRPSDASESMTFGDSENVYAWCPTQSPSRESLQATSQQRSSALGRVIMATPQVLK